MKPLIAKLTRPRLANVVERKRLLARLNSVGEKKIVWISAPAGSGKTTLVTQWLDSRKLPSIWYQVDEGDADIATFFSYMGIAAKQAAPRYRTPLPLLTPEYRPGLPTFTKRFFEALFSRLKPPFCIVIDNYQDVPADSSFHEVVHDGLSAAPDGFTIVIVSRSDPPPMFSRLLASGRLQVLRRLDIGFTFEESRELVASRGRKRLADDVLKALYRMTEGWAAGLVLLTESSITRDDLPELWEVPSDHIFDYFASELFGRTDDEMRLFLMKTSFLPTITVRTAEDLTGNTHSDQILSRLSHANFFTERHTTPMLTYKYHPLFREFLQLRAKEWFEHDDLLGIKKKAALLLLKADQAEDAARLLIDVSDWRGLTELILHSAKTFMAAGRFLTIGTWINSIPADIVERTGWLLYWKASCRLATRPAAARATLEIAYPLFQSDGDAAGSFMSWAGIVDTFMYEWKDFKPLDRWIDEFSSLLLRYNGFPSVEVEERAISSIFTALMFRQPHHPDLPRWTERVRIIMMNTEEAAHRMFIGYNLILYYLWTGRIHEAGALVSMLSPIIREMKAAPLPKLMLLRSEALYHFYVTRTEAGLQAVEQGLRLAEETGVHHLDLMFYGVAIYHATFRGDRHLAEHYLERMRSVLNQGGCYAVIYHATQSSLVALLKGDLDTAVTQAETGFRLTDEAGVPLLINSNQAAFILVLSEVNRPDEIDHHIAELRSRAIKTKSTHVEAWCSIIEAHRALQVGNELLFINRFSRAVDVCKKTGLRLLVFLRGTMARICAKALELGVETDFAKELIKLNSLVPDTPENVSESWPWPLKIYTLGRFELFVDDKPVTFSGKIQQKPLALLKALIAFGGTGVSEERITDALWPDADGDMAHQSFDTTLHRLRKMINNDNAVVLREGQVSLDERYCWVDTWSFERVLCETENVGKQKGRRFVAKGHEDEEEPVRLIEKAISLYNGHFLPGDTKQPWTISLRERLRAKFMHSINTLGSRWMEAGRYDKAAQVFVNGLAIDDLAEEFYQHLMVCYHHMGQQTEAIKTYNRCRDVLRGSLGLKPSSKTEGIYYAIRQEK
jgi:ATP/maltotriose-dependent transcriptional regulator MalT/DNA-binding SARP family transcriptional activator